MLNVETPVLTSILLPLINDGNAISPTKLISPATFKSPPTPKLLVTVDVPTTSKLDSGFVLPTPSLPSCVNDRSSALFCPYIHENLPV